MLMDPRTPHTPFADEPAAPPAGEVQARVRASLPSLSLPMQPFGAPRLDSAQSGGSSIPMPVSGAPVLERPHFAAGPSPFFADDYSSAGSLTDFHLAVSDRRVAPRGSNERRSVPRPYASPWMAGPVEGSIDPRPLAQPDDSEPRLISPIGTIMPEIPTLPALDVATRLAEPAAAPLTGFAPPLVSADAPPAPALIEQVTAPVMEAPHAVGDPLGGIFGMPGVVQVAAIDPNAWFPGAGPVNAAPAPDAPVAVAAAEVATAAPAVATAVAASPWRDVAAASNVSGSPADPLLTMSADTRQDAPAPSTEAAPAPVSPHVLNELPLAQQITSSLALQPHQPPVGAGTAQARSGSTLVRATLLVGAPAAAGCGIGYLLSLLVG